MSKTNKIVLSIAGILVVALAVYAYMHRDDANEGTGANGAAVICTLDAKLCPDGSYVGRTGPNCEFAECPTSSAATSGTQTGNLQPDGTPYPADLSK